MFFFLGTLLLVASPLRVVAISPSAVDTIAYLKESSTIVGVSQYTPLAHATNVGDMTFPNVSKIALLHPDYVIVDKYTSPQIVEKLKSLKLSVVVVNQSYTLQGVYQSMRTIGALYHQEAKINQLIAQIESVLKKNSASSSLSVYYMLSFGREGNYSVNNNTFSSNIIEALGMKNITASNPTNAVSISQLLLANPSIIVISQAPQYGSMITLADLQKTAPYNQLKAVKEGKVYYVNSDDADRPGPRIMKFIQELVEIKKENSSNR